MESEIKSINYMDGSLNGLYLSIAFEGLRAAIKTVAGQECCSPDIHFIQDLINTKQQCYQFDCNVQSVRCF
jgi:hypothetical protein